MSESANRSKGNEMNQIKKTGEYSISEEDLISQKQGVVSQRRQLFSLDNLHHDKNN
jgi:hypothetical protein